MQHAGHASIGKWRFRIIASARQQKERENERDIEQIFGYPFEASNMHNTNAQVDSCA